MNESDFYNQVSGAKTQEEFNAICSKVNETTLKYLCFSLRNHNIIVNKIQRYLYDLGGPQFDLTSIGISNIINIWHNDPSPENEKILDRYSSINLARVADTCSGGELSHKFAKYLFNRWQHFGDKIQFSDAAYTYIANSLNSDGSDGYVNIIPCLSDLFKEIIDIANKHHTLSRVNCAIMLTNLTCGHKGQTAVGYEPVQIRTSINDSKQIVETPKQIVETPKQIVEKVRPMVYHDFMNAKIDYKMYTGLTDFFLTLITNPTLAYEQLISGIVSKEELIKPTLEGRTPLTYLISSKLPNAPAFIFALIASGGFDDRVHPLRLALSQCKIDDNIDKFEKVLMHRGLFTKLDLKDILLILYPRAITATDTTKSIVELLCKYQVINVTLADYPVLAEFPIGDMTHFINIVLKN